MFNIPAQVPCLNDIIGQNVDRNKLLLFEWGTKNFFFKYNEPSFSETLKF